MAGGENLYSVLLTGRDVTLGHPLGDGRLGHAQPLSSRRLTIAEMLDDLFWCHSEIIRDLIIVCNKRKRRQWITLISIEAKIAV